MVIVYSAVWCGFCHTAMQYFDKLGIAYETRDVDDKQEYARESIEKSGQMGIPVIDINGTIVVGFNKPQIDKVLKEQHLLA